MRFCDRFDPPELTSEFLCEVGEPTQLGDGIGEMVPVRVDEVGGDRPVVIDREEDEVGTQRLPDGQSA